MRTRCAPTCLPTPPAPEAYAEPLWELACVGAGLLANAVDQSPNVLTDTPHSRASPLPHWFVSCQGQKRTPVVTIAALNPNNTNSAATGP